MKTGIHGLQDFASKIALGPRPISPNISFAVRSVNSNSPDNKYPDILVRQEGEAIVYRAQLIKYAALDEKERLALFEKLLNEMFVEENFIGYSIDQEHQQAYLQVRMPFLDDEETDQHLFIVAHRSMSAALKEFIDS